MSDFFANYKDARWQKKRLEIMQRDNFTCTACGTTSDDGVSLHVHHAEYIKGKKPWEYEGDELSTKCDACHKKIHDTISDVRRFLTGASSDQISGMNMMTLDYMADFVDEVGRATVIPTPIFIVSLELANSLYKRCDGDKNYDVDRGKK